MTATNTGTLDILGQIISNQMNISIDRIFAQNQTQDLPKDEGLFVVIGYMARTPYANKTKYDIVNNQYTEKQSLNMAEDILISLVSRNNDARDRAYEVSMALKSTYSQYLQEKNHLHISTIHEILDSSFLEASARLNRYDIRCRVIRGYYKQHSVSYYDKFYFEAWVKENNDIKKESFNIE